MTSTLGNSQMKITKTWLWNTTMDPTKPIYNIIIIYLKISPSIVSLSVKRGKCCLDADRLEKKMEKIFRHLFFCFFFLFLLFRPSFSSFRFFMVFLPQKRVLGVQAYGVAEVNLQNHQKRVLFIKKLSGEKHKHGDLTDV